MWMMRRKSAEELDSILYFLSNALTSVIEDNSYLAQHSAMAPKIGAGLATAEIASRLAMFREQVCDVSRREYMVVTKLARARHWARELRRHEPHLRADIDAFLSLTARCEAMARDCAPDPESLFDGEGHPKRFLAGRVPGGRSAAEAALSLMDRLRAAERGEPLANDQVPRYLIGGELSVEALDEVCEGLLARLSEHYGWDEDGADAIGEDEAEARDDEPAEVLQPGEAEPAAQERAKESSETTDTKAAESESAAEPSAEPETGGASDAASSGDGDAQADEAKTGKAKTTEAETAATEDPFTRSESETDSPGNRSDQPPAQAT